MKNGIVLQDNLTPTSFDNVIQNLTIHMGLAANIWGGIPEAATTGQYGNVDIGAFYVFDRPLSNTEMSNAHAFLSG